MKKSVTLSAILGTVLVVGQVPSFASVTFQFDEAGQYYFAQTVGGNTGPWSSITGVTVGTGAYDGLGNTLDYTLPYGWSFNVPSGQSYAVLVEDSSGNMSSLLIFNNQGANSHGQVLVYNSPATGAKYSTSAYSASHTDATYPTPLPNNPNYMADILPEVGNVVTEKDAIQAQVNPDQDSFGSIPSPFGPAPGVELIGGDSTDLYLGGGTTTFNFMLDVPEPTTCLEGALLLLPFGMITLRGLRKNRTA